ncbi:MAG: 4-aminobutyrate--2-oxoglutarate transaminase [Clostridiales bacterium]
MINETTAKIITDSVPGPKSMEVYEKRKDTIARGVSNLSKICVDEAKNALLKDIDGNIFIDFASGIGVQNIGHCDEEIINAINKQSKKLIHPCFHVAMYEQYITLGEKLAKLTKGSFDKKVMFANSGAEAVENAIKIARKYTRKTGVLSLECAFHGRTFMAMTLTSKVKPYKNGFGPFMPDTHKIPTGYCYRCEYKLSYPECNVICANKLETLLKGELSADDIAALIVEPIQGEGGFITPPAKFYKKLQKICNDNNIIFIVDEIQSGFGRTGKMFAYQHYNIEPDIITLSKSIAAGLPLSAVVGKSEIMDAPGPGEIGGTYGGSPLACVAALKVIEKIEKESLELKALEIEKILKNRLTEMSEKTPYIGDIRGKGAMVAVEFVKDKTTKEPNAELCKNLIENCLKEGVLFISAGIYSNLIRFLPPLTITNEQIHYAMDILERNLYKAKK